MRQSFIRPAGSALLITASAFALITASPALAQQQPQADNVDDIVVTGTRVVGRSRLDSVAPVDVVTAETLQQRGSTELATQLAASVPALNFPRPSATDGTDSDPSGDPARPGAGPDAGAGERRASPRHRPGEHQRLGRARFGRRRSERHPLHRRRADRGPA
nr:hypothetical protein [uncultured Brevundimonas sp.]